MNVLYVLKRYPRLSETFVVREIAELEARGLTIGIDALLPPEPGPVHPDVAMVAARVRYLPRRPRMRREGVLAAHAAAAARRPVAWAREALRARRGGTWRRFLQAGLVAQRARQEGAQGIHAHFATAAAEVAGHASALAGVPFTVTAHAKDIFTEANAAQLGRRVGRARAVVTVSDHNRAHLASVLPRADVRVVRNGVALRPPTGPVAGGPILCVARLVEKKGLDLLMDAVAILAASRPEVRLELIGGGPLHGPLFRRAEALGIGDVVTFRGPLAPDEVEEAYRRCSMVALACRIGADGDRDGMPTVIVEALAHGLPVVTTDVVGIGELVRHRRTGLLVPPEDPTGLAGAMAELLDDLPLARALGEAGRAAVAGDYDPGRSAASLARVLVEAAA